jgi:hypothetical protein
MYTIHFFSRPDSFLWTSKEMNKKQSIHFCLDTKTKQTRLPSFRLANYKKYLILFKKEWGELSLRLD